METNPTLKSELSPGQKIIFRLRNIHVIELELSECEILSEIKSLLSENPFLKLHPNIKFLCQNTKINEFLPLSEQVDVSKRQLVVDIAFEPFNARTAEKHVFQCAEFFLKPAKFLSDGFIEFNTLVGKTEFIQQMIDGQRQEVRLFPCEQALASDLRLLESLSFLPQPASEALFFKQLAFSRYNPPAGPLRLQDEFFYLDLCTKEGQYFCLTVARKGLFANESTEAAFSDRPRSRAFLSLVDLLAFLSPEFEHDLQGFVSFEDQATYDAQLNSPSLTPNNHAEVEATFKSPAGVSLWKSSLESLAVYFADTKFGQNTKLYRDWNEEFQNCRSLPSGETLQQLQKIKILRKICDDFARAAKEIACAVVENQLIPLNPTENKIEECYVFNNLFVTFAQDRDDWEMPRSETSPSTFSGVNADILNLQQIYNGDLSSVNVIHTACVDYFGHRVVVQAIISGILHFDQKTWNCYGTIDDGKTINNEPDFATLFESLCNQFSLTLANVFKDESGKEFVIHGSPEVKGIKAGDGRKYVMDLMRLSPRDANFADRQKHECCVLRPELIKNYVFMNNLEEVMSRNGQKAKADSAEEPRPISPEQNGESPEPVEEGKKEATPQTEEPKPTEDQSTTQKEEPSPVLAEGELAEREADEAFSKKSCRFNPSLLTLLESHNPTNATDLESLTELSKFLNSSAIGYFISELNSTPNAIPIDMESFVDLMHKYGINVRYIGTIYRQLDPKVNCHILRLIERIVFVRALRKFVRQLAGRFQQGDLLATAVLLLNIVLGDFELRSFYDQKVESQRSKQNGQSVAPGKSGAIHDKPKKSKNKKKKAHPRAGGSPSEPGESLGLSSSEVFGALRDIAAGRYQLPAEKLKTFESLQCLREPKDKLTFQREFCRAFGLVLQPRTFAFASNKLNVEYPIKARDIVQVRPRIKSPSFVLDGLKYNYKAAENEIAEKNLDNALAILKGCQNLIVNTYGIYNNDFVFATSKLASVVFLKGRVEEAIRTQLFVVRICEKIFGLDHFNTAFAIVELSNYFYEAKRVEESVSLHSTALLIFDLVGGFINPSSLLCLHELQVLTAQLKHTKQSSAVLEELLRRNEIVFGEADERLSFLLGKLAAVKSEMGAFKDASLLQARQSFILKRILKSAQFEQNPRLKQVFVDKVGESERLQEFYVRKSKEAAEGAVTAEEKKDAEAVKGGKTGKRKAKN